MVKKGYIAFLFLLASLLAPQVGARELPQGRQSLEQAIAANDFHTANKILLQQTQHFLALGKIDSLVSYVELTGRVANGISGDDKAVAAVLAFVGQIRKVGADNRQMAKASRRAVHFFYSLNQYAQAYTTARQALAYTLKHTPHSATELAAAYHLLGECANFNNDLTNALVYLQKAYQLRIENKAAPSERYESVAALAKVMLNLSNPDSALSLYKEALSLLTQMPPDIENSYYNPGIVYKNIAIINNTQGASQQAIQHSYKSIDFFRQYIRRTQSDKSLKRAKTDLCRAVENLSIFYSQIGDIGRANDLLLYSYQIKLANLRPDDAEVVKTEVLLGSNYNNIGDYNKSIQYLTKAIERSKEIDEGALLLSLGDAWYIMATVNYNLKHISEARTCFQTADSLYEIAYQDVYDDMYADFLRNLTLFYARNGDYPKALAKANLAYERLPSANKEAGLHGFYKKLNIAVIHYYGKNYQLAYRYSSDALQTIDEKLVKGRNKLDSAKMEIFKPQAIYLQSRSLYEMEPNRNPVFLERTMRKLDEALQILSRRRGFVDEAYNVQYLIEYNRDLIEFAKTVAFELHMRTGSAQYLERFINLHESSLYTRIRSRLDQEEAVRFSNVPRQVLAEELELKHRIKSVLSGESDKPDLIHEYLTAIHSWEKHLEQVRKDFPRYYQLRYATLFRPLQQIQSAIPGDATLVRYYFIDTSLVALVADKHKKTVIRLPSSGLEQMVLAAQQSSRTEKDQLAVLHQLYQQVWAPLEPYVRTSRVVIIPDGLLYNLSFDMLPVRPLLRYKQLQQHSLLARHSFSYHYSLFMLNVERKEVPSGENYVAFAPGFSDNMKSAYAARLKDSILLDQAYLTLLPQPTTARLVKQIKEDVGGKLFLETKATKSAFEKYAGNHKVIHIATHAEYNNVYPERSGLIFAKSRTINDTNRLYLSDIYNCDLRAELTLLTACETGRPGYQDGEGMVSLAHAFNYAGSNNILMALWKVDEQASSDITAAFVGYIKQGLPTDQALQRAKLDYLARAEGRPVHPGYWSGLILLGEPAVISLQSVPSSYWPFLLALPLTAGCYLFFRYRRRRRRTVF